MSEQASTFQTKSEIKATDLEHRRKINFNIGKYNAVVPTGKSQFHELEVARQRAKNLKWKALENLYLQLESFEANITRRRAKVIWAETAKQARDEISHIGKASS